MTGFNVLDTTIICFFAFNVCAFFYMIRKHLKPIILVCLKLCLLDVIFIIVLVTCIRNYKIISFEQLQGSSFWRIGELVEFVVRILRR